VAQRRVGKHGVGEGEVDEGKKGPDRGEDEEVELRDRGLVILME